MSARLESIFDSLSKPILSEVERLGLSGEHAVKLVERFVSEAHEDLAATLLTNAPQMLKQDSEFQSGFEERNHKRWAEPLDLLRTLWMCCHEIGQSHAHEGPREGDPIVFDTLARLHPRALLVASEILCLIKGGFADGALTRWRSLHELTVISMFIAKHGYEAEFSYRLSLSFERARAARQYNEFASRANLTPIGDDELLEIDAELDVAKKALGRDLKRDWDWAVKFLAGRPANFASIELDIGLDHWRPRYKWACQHIHAGFFEHHRLLGMSEAKEVMFQVGPSNSGMVDPLHMTAISLVQSAITFIFYPEPNLDRVVFARVLQTFVDKIGDAAQRAANEATGEPDGG